MESGIARYSAGNSINADIMPVMRHGHARRLLANAWLSVHIATGTAASLTGGSCIPTFNVLGRTLGVNHLPRTVVGSKSRGTEQSA